MSIYLDEFETLYGISDNIEDLRNKILELAFKGELVEKKQKNSFDFLNKIKAKKEKMIKDKIVRKPYGGIKEIKSEDRPYDIPDNWNWIRLAEVMNFQNGYAFKSSEFISEGVGLVKIGNISDGEISEVGMDYISKEKSVDEKYYVKPNDMVIAMSGATTGKIGINKKDKTYYLNQRVGKISPIYTNQKYMYYYLKTLMAENLSKSSGSAIPNLSTKQINNIMFPFPPLEEQKRIVERIKYLMEQGDDLEERLKEKENISEKLSESVVKAISNSKDGEELKENLKFIISNLDVIFKTPESMQELRNVVLQLAIEGKLVEQDPSDEPASELIKKIEKEKERLIAEGEIKKSRSKIKEIKDEDIPFEIPESWSWARLGNITNKITDGAHHTPKYTKEGIPFLSVKDISSGKLEFSNTKFISKKTHKKLYKRCNPEKGDLLLTKVGTTGVPVIVDTDREFSLFVSVALLKFNNSLLYNKYLKHFINSPYIKFLSEENTKGVGNKNLVLRDIRNFLFPVPPLEEQKRIVEKVDSIMNVIDKLEEELTKKNDIVEKLGAI